MTLNETLEKVKSIARKYRAVERCGFIGEKKGEFYIQESENKSPTPNEFFVISPLEYLNFKKNHNLIAVYHTHIYGEPHPSTFDIRMSNGCCVPFLIYGIDTDSFHLHVPPQHEINEELIKQVKCSIS